MNLIQFHLFRNEESSDFKPGVRGFVILTLIAAAYFSTATAWSQDPAAATNQSEEQQPAATETDAQPQAKRSLTVLRIDVRGNRAISTNTILNNMKTQMGTELSQQILNEDVKRLYATGFFQDVRIDLEEKQAGVQL